LIFIIKMDKLKNIVKEILKQGPYDVALKNLNNKIGITPASNTNKFKEYKKILLKDLSLDDNVKGKIFLPTGTDDVSTININDSNSQKQLDWAKEKLITRFGDKILDSYVIINPNKVWYDQFEIEYQPLKDFEQKYFDTIKKWLKK